MESPLALGHPTHEELEARAAAERLGEPFLVYRNHPEVTRYQSWQQPS